MRVKGRSNKLLITQGELVEKSLLESAQEEYKQDNADFFIIVIELRKTQALKKTAKTVLDTLLRDPKRYCRRAKAFIEFIYKYFNNAGRNAYSNLKAVFLNSLSICKAICFLNIFTLQRNGPLKYDYSKSPLTQTNIKVALKHPKSNN